MKAGDLLEARSSHASYYRHPYIFIVGGNRQNHIITKSCERYNIVTQQTEEMACLNHCAAGVALACHGRFLYKFGGVGEKFESYGMSPYIERYDLDEDCWEVVNPDFSPSVVDRDPFRVLSFSCAFLLEANTIVVMGGYDQDKQAHRFAYALNIIDEDEYFISSLDESFLPEAGGFWHNTPTYYNGRIHFLMNSPKDPTISRGTIAAIQDKLLLEFDGSVFSRIYG